MRDKAIYIVLTATQTNFARCIRYFGRTKYNHASVSLDEGLTRMYSFARPQKYSFFKGRCVRETLDRFTMREGRSVPAVIFRIPVTAYEHRRIKKFIRRIYNDKEYMYNLISVISYPLTHGFPTYKALSCTEFTSLVLKKMGFPMPYKPWSYKPDDLISILGEYTIYKGDLSDYMTDEIKSRNFFEEISFDMFISNLTAAARIILRTAINRKGMT
jgi:hypothetical protein